MSDTTEIHATHREVELLETLRAQGGSARTAKLAETLSVSEETVRRTVKALAKSGLVERVHGGVYLSNSEALSPVGMRLGTRTQEKLSIAREVAKLIPSGSSV
ncbi:MAG: DeoR family transcriptional regulator, partial [Marinomonas sp.]